MSFQITQHKLHSTHSHVKGHPCIPFYWYRTSTGNSLLFRYAAPCLLLLLPVCPTSLIFLPTLVHQHTSKMTLSHLDARRCIAWKKRHVRAELQTTCTLYGQHKTNASSANAALHRKLIISKNQPLEKILTEKTMLYQ